MEGNGNSHAVLPDYSQHPVSNHEALNNDGYPTSFSVVPIAESGASADRDQELQVVPDVPGWKPEWVRFLKNRGDMTAPGDASQYTYTLPQITELLHVEFGPETYTLTEIDLIDVWKKYIGPTKYKDRKGKSVMNQTELSGGPSMPVGGSNGESRSGNGYQHEATGENPGSIHREAPPNAYTGFFNGQSSRHEGHGAHHSGVSSSRDGPQDRFGGPHQNEPSTDEPFRLPPLRSQEIWNMGREDPHRGSSRATYSNSEQEPTRSAAGYGSSGIPAPSTAGAAVHHGLIPSQPRRYTPTLGQSLYTQDRRGFRNWYERDFPRDARR